MVNARKQLIDAKNKAWHDYWQFDKLPTHNNKILCPYCKSPKFKDHKFKQRWRGTWSCVSCDFACYNSTVGFTIEVCPKAGCRLILGYVYKSQDKQYIDSYIYYSDLLTDYTGEVSYMKDIQNWQDILRLLETDKIYKLLMLGIR